MRKELPKLEQPAPVYDVDLSEGWDTESQVKVLIKWLKAMPFYKSNLLYCGFDADDIGRTSGARMTNGKTFFASPEKYLIDDEGANLNPYLYATVHYNRPAIAVYASEKVEATEEDDHEFRVKDASALIAVLRLS